MSWSSDMLALSLEDQKKEAKKAKQSHKTWLKHWQEIERKYGEYKLTPEASKIVRDAVEKETLRVSNLLKKLEL